MADPTYIVCQVCGEDRFAQARRIYTVNLEDGTKQRNWAVGAADASEIVCVLCGTLYRWNPDTQTFDIVERIIDIPGVGTGVSLSVRKGAKP